MNDSFEVCLKFSTFDKNTELRLAIIESQIQDTYDAIGFDTQLTPDGGAVQLTIHFKTLDDQCHWLLTFDNQLTQLQSMLYVHGWNGTCEHEQTRNLLQR